MLLQRLVHAVCCNLAILKNASLYKRVLAGNGSCRTLDFGRLLLCKCVGAVERFEKKLVRIWRKVKGIVTLWLFILLWLICLLLATRCGVGRNQGDGTTLFMGKK